MSASVAALTGPRVATNRAQSWIFEKPRVENAHVGWLRAGAKIKRAETPTAGSDCKGKWWEVEPAGFVCEGHEGVTTDMDDKTVAAASAYLPDRNAPLPYGYVTSYGAPLYTRVPTPDEQKLLEGDVAAVRARWDAIRSKMEPNKLPPETPTPLAPMPSFLEGHQKAPSLFGGPLPPLTNGQAWNNMRLSIITSFESEGRPFLLTTEHYVVPADRMRSARLADFRGVELGKTGEPGEHLPMLWVRWRPAHLHKLVGGHVVDTDETLPFQAHAMITMKDRIVDNTKYHELVNVPPTLVSDVSATWLVRPQEVTRVDAATELPYDVAADESWIEVAIQRQSLVLYRGLTPVFITLVSTGVDGVDEWKTTRATPRGHFRIHSKHLTWRMAADEHPPWKDGGDPDPRYRIDDVPYVQYFQSGYALHAAFWHDAFGQPKSHGCINLSPRDALWLFGQTEPKLPEGWHGIYSGRAGVARGTTLIVKVY